MKPHDCGLECVKLILSRRCVHSDRDAAHLAQAFTAAGLTSQAKSVLLARAQHWAQFRTGNLYRYAPKALAFYLKAGSSSHAKMLLEYSLHQCIGSALNALLASTVYVTPQQCASHISSALAEAEGMLGAIASVADKTLCGDDLVHCLSSFVAACHLLTTENTNESHYAQAVQYLLKCLRAKYLPTRFARSIVAITVWASEQCTATACSLTLLSREDVNFMLHLVNVCIYLMLCVVMFSSCKM